MVIVSLIKFCRKKCENWTSKNCKVFDRKEGYGVAHPAKMYLNKKWLPKQKTIQNFNIDAQGFRETRNENPPTWEIGVTS